jgi:hypothetical protein
MFVLFIAFPYYVAATELIIRNINVTTNHDIQITINQIAAFFNIFVQVFTFQSSPAAVSIWNHHRKQRISAINQSIHSTRLIAFFIVVISLSSQFTSVEVVHTTL